MGESWRPPHGERGASMRGQCLAGLAPIWHWGRGPVVSPADATRGQQRAASAWASSCLPAASWCAGARRGLRDISISMVGRGSWWTASVCELSPACPNHRAEGACSSSPDSSLEADDQQRAFGRDREWTTALSQLPGRFQRRWSHDSMSMALAIRENRADSPGFSLFFLAQ